jgi:MazG family protein
MTQRDAKSLAADASAAFGELVEVMRRLLGPDGCPWDREQTLASLRPYLLEEAYEVLEALDGGDPAEHCEELGDLLMQIVFQAELRDAEGAFTLADVARGIATKLVRRHPHIFSDSRADSPEEVEAQWEAIKAEEKRARGAGGGALAGVPAALPALARAQKISRRAADVGFDWPDPDGCRRKVEEELEEIEGARHSGDPQAVAAEVGDALYAMVSFSRKLGVDAELALREATSRFERRFEHMEAEIARSGGEMREASIDELEERWQRAKRALEGPS